MSFSRILTSLSLPPDVRIDYRVPKKLLVEQGARTTIDKRQILDGIEDLFWVAALKPTNTGLASFHDSDREYLEIVVATVTLRSGAKVSRLTELIHRAIPYPLILIAMEPAGVRLSFAHKRWSQGHTNRLIIENLHRTVILNVASLTPNEDKFLQSLALSSLQANNLYGVYQCWIDRVVALEASLITADYIIPKSSERLASVYNELEKHAKVKSQLDSLRSKAVRETQLKGRVELNLEIQRLETELSIITNRLANGESQ